uniref:ASPSCR1 tether for SLC2A4, UBX domain containing n=1 Tax=Hucho hucho TaxID=62062 RepID=A0A4W5PYC9_9TELE
MRRPAIIHLWFSGFSVDKHIYDTHICDTHTPQSLFFFFLSSLSCLLYRASELSESGSTPVCVYMRDEVSGEAALQKASLKSLGLTGGSAIVRLKTKSPGNGDDDGMETASTATDPVTKETKPHPLPPVEPPPSQPERAALPSIKKESPDRPVETADAPVPAPSAAGSTLPGKQEAEVVPISQNAVRPKSSPFGGVKGEEEGDGERAGPSGQCSVHPSSSSSSPPSAPFIPFSGGGQRLGGPGASGVGASSSSLPSMVGGPPKAKRSKPNNAKRQASAKQDDWAVVEEPVDREPLIYHMDSGARRYGNEQDLPDEFFEVTVDDIRKRFAQLKSESVSLPLSLQAGLFPAALVYFGSDVKTGHYLERHLLDSSVSALQADEAIAGTHTSLTHLPLSSIHPPLYRSPPNALSFSCP